ncbi:MAG: ATP synthase F1 subunit delta, partial [Myxococcota bacterium]
TSVGDLRNALENPSYSSEERLSVLDAVSGQLELSPRVKNFARLVVERGRAEELTEMSETFASLLDERTGRTRALITSAQPLEEAEADRIREALEKRTGKTIEVELAVDPALIGGVRAEVGTIVFDGTIRAELDKLREQLGDDA